MRFTTILTVAALAGLLVLTGCDLADTFGGGPDGQPSDALQVAEDVKPFIPNGLPRVIFDVLLMGLAVVSSTVANKKAKASASKELAETEAREYTLEEAESMAAALKRLNDSKAPTAE